MINPAWHVSVGIKTMGNIAPDNMIWRLIVLLSEWLSLITQWYPQLTKDSRNASFRIPTHPQFAKFLHSLAHCAIYQCWLC